MSENPDTLLPEVVKQSLDAMRPFLGNAMLSAMSRILDTPGVAETRMFATGDSARSTGGMMRAIRGRRR